MIKAHAVSKIATLDRLVRRFYETETWEEWVKELRDHGH